MQTPSTTKTVFSADEISEKLNNLSTADFVRIRKIAAFYGKGYIEPDELISKAFIAILSGARNCPTDVNVIAFLANTMRSLASSNFKSLDRSPEFLEVIPSIEGEFDGLPSRDYPSQSPSAEETLLLTEEIGFVLSLFADDEITHLIVEGLLEGMSSSELQELACLDKTSYESKRKLIRRRLDKAKSKGMFQ